MAAIPRELIESELFGHERGAFTGATNRSQGRFEQANGGTLFLDEIGDMPPEAQTRLLRVLQEGEFTSVGGRQPIKANVRIIAATHRDLRNVDPPGAVPRGSVLPPERRADPAAAVARTHRGHSACWRGTSWSARARTGCRPSRSTPRAVDKLRQYSWPGNVRELENLMRRLAALCPQEMITAECDRRRTGRRGAARRSRPPHQAPRRRPWRAPSSATSASSSLRTMTAWAHPTSMTG